MNAGEHRASRMVRVKLARFRVARRRGANGGDSGRAGGAGWTGYYPHRRLAGRRLAGDLPHSCPGATTNTTCRHARRLAPRQAYCLPKHCPYPVLWLTLQATTSHPRASAFPSHPPPPHWEEGGAAPDTFPSGLLYCLLPLHACDIPAVPLVGWDARHLDTCLACLQCHTHATTLPPSLPFTCHPSFRYLTLPCFTLSPR